MCLKNGVLTLVWIVGWSSADIDQFPNDTNLVTLTFSWQSSIYVLVLDDVKCKVFDWLCQIDYNLLSPLNGTSNLSVGVKQQDRLYWNRCCGHTCVMTIHNGKVSTMVSWVLTRGSLRLFCSGRTCQRTRTSSRRWELRILIKCLSKRSLPVLRRYVSQVSWKLTAPFLPRDIFKLLVYKKSCSFTSWYYTFCVDSLHTHCLHTTIV